MKNRKDLYSSIRKRYIKCHTKLFTLGLSPNAIAIYSYMLSCSEDYNPSIRELCQLFRLGRHSTYRAINELLDSQVIFIAVNADRVGKKAAIYAFCSVDRWTKIVTIDVSDQNLI